MRLVVVGGGHLFVGHSCSNTMDVRPISLQIRHDVITGLVY
jgi:hypothetical protein